MNPSDTNQNLILKTDWNSIIRIQGLWFVASFILCLFSFPLSSYFSEFIGIESNVLSIFARAITVINCFAYFLFLIIYGLFKPAIHFYFFLVFWLFYGIRIIYDTSFHSFQLGRPPSDYYLFAFFLSFFCSIPFYIPVKIPWKVFEKWVFFILILLNFFGLYNNLAADNIFLERLGGNERLNPIAFGLQASLLIILSLIKILRGGSVFWWKPLLLICIIIGMFNLFVAASKSPIIFLLLSILLITIYFIKHKNKKAVLLITGIITLVIGLIFLLGLEDIIFLALNRFTEIKQDESSYERLSMLRGGLNQFLENPLYGSFLEEKIWKEYPHNLILEAFMALGILGGFYFSIFYLMLWYETVRNTINTNLSTLCFVCLSVLTLTLTSGGLSFSSDFWVVGATMFALTSQLKPNGKLHKDIVS